LKLLDGRKLKVYRGVLSDYFDTAGINLVSGAPEMKVAFNSVEPWTFNKNVAKTFTVGK